MVAMGPVWQFMQLQVITRCLGGHWCCCSCLWQVSEFIATFIILAVGRERRPIAAKRVEEKYRDMELYAGETLTLVMKRWEKLEKDFYSKKKERFDIRYI